MNLVVPQYCVSQLYDSQGVMEIMLIPVPATCGAIRDTVERFVSTTLWARVLCIVFIVIGSQTTLICVSYSANGV